MLVSSDGAARTGPASVRPPELPTEDEGKPTTDAWRQATPARDRQPNNSSNNHRVLAATRTQPLESKTTERGARG